MASSRSGSSSSSSSGSSRWLKQEKIGRGSFGQVWKANDTRTGAIVALKEIDLDAAEDDIDDIQREVSILAQLDSPHITKYLSAFSSGHILSVVMEYCAGGSAADLLKSGPFDEIVLATMLLPVVQALEYLHARGFLHRDIKAANILLTSAGSVKLADFGVSGMDEKPPHG